MDTDIAEHVRKCLWCRREKESIRKRAGKMQRSVRDHDGTTFSIDLMGPFPVSPEGYKYILTMMDPFSHYLVAVPLIRKQ